MPHTLYIHTYLVLVLSKYMQIVCWIMSHTNERCMLRQSSFIQPPLYRPHTTSFWFNMGQKVSCWGEWESDDAKLHEYNYAMELYIITMRRRITGLCTVSIRSHGIIKIRHGEESTCWKAKKEIIFMFISFTCHSDSQIPTPPPVPTSSREPFSFN